MKYIVGHCTDKGIRKEVNQDSFLVKIAKSKYGRIALFIICDGMGGLSEGELASATVVREFKKWYDEEVPSLNFNTLTAEEICLRINSTVENANIKILEYGKSNRLPLGTTLTLMFIVDRAYYICQVGDSRAYRLTNGINKLTNDQTLVAREVELGKLTEEEAKTDRRRNILLQCVGAKKIVEPEYLGGTLNGNETFLLCSDGFYRKLTEEELLQIGKDNVINSSKLTEKANELVEIIKSRKEVDNITAIIIKTVE